MDFTVISLGNTEFLAQVLNAVAVICGTGDWARLIAVGFVFGLLFIGFQCIFEGGQKVNLHHSFLCFLCYLCMFGPSCTVNVEDAYNGEVRRIDNLPLGVGAAGMAISGIGYGVTRLMEQGFATTDRTSEHQFAEPLRILNDMRTLSDREELFNTINTLLGARTNGQPSDAKQAIVNYLSECTMAKVQLGLTTPARLASAGWDSGEFKFESQAHMTYLPIGGIGTDEILTCNDAYDKLGVIFSKFGEQEFAVTVNSLLHINDQGSSTVPTDLDTINNAMGALGLTMNGAQDFIRMTVIEGVYNEAAKKFYTSQQDIASAIAVNQAIMQRNTQWAAESTMFLSAARGLMAFFEGFIYAITPIVGFLMAIGTFGVSLAGKYFLTVAWIQLWLPILSILNLYIMVGARTALTQSALGDASFFVINNVWTQAQTWVSTGGMLTAATPMLALFLITGSTYAFTALAGRMGGQDHFNERIQTPDAVQPSAVMSHLPNYTSDRVTGSYVTNSTQAVPKINLGKALASNEANKAAVHNAETANLSATVSKALGDGNTSTATAQFTESVGRSVAQTVMSNGQTVGSYVRQQTGQTGDLTSHQYQQLGQTALTLQGGVAGNSSESVIGSVLKATTGLGFNADVSASGSSQSKESLTSGKETRSNFSRQVSAQDTQMLAAALRTGSDAAMKNMTSEQWSSLSKAEQNGSVSRAFNNMAVATRGVEQATTASRNLSMMTDTNAMTMAQSFRGTAMWTELSNFGHHLSVADRGEYAKTVDQYRRFLPDAEQANVAAALNYMADRASTNAGYADKLANFMANSNYPMVSNMPKQTDVGSLKKPTEGFTQEMVNSGTELYNAQRGELEGARAQATQRVSSDYRSANDHGIRNEHDKGLQRVDQQSGVFAGRASAQAQTNALHAITQPTNNGVGVMVANNVLKDGPVESVMKWIKDRAPTAPTVLNRETFGDYLGRHAHLQSLGGFTLAQQRYMEAYHNYRYLAPNDSKPVRDAIDGLRQEVQQTHYPNVEKLNATQQARVTQITQSLMNRMEEAHAVDNQANMQSIMQYNNAFGLKTSPRV